MKTNLDAYANENGLPRDYSDAFFPAARVAKSSAGKASGSPAPAAPSGG